MAKIKNKTNGGVVETTDEQAQRLIARGGWTAADKPEPKKAPAAKAPAKPSVKED